MNIVILGLSKREKKSILSQFTLVELFQELHRRAQLPDEEEDEEEEEEEFEFLSKEEKEYAFGQLASRYPHGEALLMSTGCGALPKWLQKEILERRKVKSG